MIWDNVKLMWYIDFDGHRRYLGRNPCSREKRAAYGIKRRSVTMIPESSWTEQDFRPYASPIKDQDGEGACVSFSGTMGHETSRALQGMSRVRLSCGHLYGQINGGSDNGAVVEDALKALEQTGQCTNALVDDMTWRSDKWPAGVGSEAARFKVEIGGEVTTFEEICSLLEVNKIVMIGIDCGRNFNPNARGILPPQSGSGGGHGLAVVGKTKKLDGIWRLIIPNSWGINWGDAGYCYMDRTFIDSAGGGHYELSASEDDPIDHNNPSKAA